MSDKENSINIRTNQNELNVNINLKNPKKHVKPDHPYEEFVTLNANKISTLNNPYNNLWLLLGNPEFTGEAAKVLFALILSLDFDNWITISITTISKPLNMNRSNVSRAIKKLENIGVIERGEKNGNSYKFRLSYKYCWKGNSSTLNLLIKNRS